jgi:hypothetical protein
MLSIFSLGSGRGFGKVACGLAGKSHNFLKKAYQNDNDKIIKRSHVK